MLVRKIHMAGALVLPESGREEAVREIVSRFPARSMRRMSRLGIYLASLFEEISPDIIGEMVYATSFTESRSLEQFLESFPFASPTYFQMSIHPGGMEQVLIKRQLSVREFFPLAGLSHFLSTACKLLLTGKSRDPLFAGGEESASWLTDAGLASADDFAFMLRLDDRGATLGELRWEPDVQTEPTEPSLKDFALAIEQRRLLAWQAPWGKFTLSWNPDGCPAD